MRRWVPLLVPLLFACAGQIPEKVDLEPQAENVEFAYETPSPTAYKFIGQVTGVAEANDLEAAQLSAKNDLRNKAAAMGAVLVTIDEDTGKAVLLVSRTRVKLVGRAYKPVD
ncbi:MAG TPA: DUF4156 domain-containing protein [Polyangiaceae bacterium]|nr:DUF4156 domain-containing protein [Polyangiaceae bacterium]